MLSGFKVVWTNEIVQKVQSPAPFLCSSGGLLDYHVMFNSALLVSFSTFWDDLAGSVSLLQADFYPAERKEQIEKEASLKFKEGGAANGASARGNQSKHFYSRTKPRADLDKYFKF